MGCANARAAPLGSDVKKVRGKDQDQTFSSLLRGAAPRDCVVRPKNDVIGDCKAAWTVSPSSKPTYGGKLSHVKEESSAEYTEPDQTIIIFDWDDTLCPTSWFQTNGAAGIESSKEEYDELSSQVVELLTKAQTLGKVVLVTNASRPWLEYSCQQLLPAAQALLQKMQIIHALELITPSDKMKYSKNALLTESKARAMRLAVSQFYSRYEGQSWKNIVSIGDARYEHDAIRRVVRHRPCCKVPFKKCRTKTIKMLEKPSAMTMTLQISTLSRYICDLVHVDNDVAIDFGTLSDFAINNVRHYRL